MEEDYFDDGFPLAVSSDGTEISFFQKDVREIQLAKSAVRAGLETLILNFGASYEDIEAIYIAGGFGYKMDIVKAVGIGLLPEECQDKIEAVRKQLPERNPDIPVKQRLHRARAAYSGEFIGSTALQ